MKNLTLTLALGYGLCASASVPLTVICRDADGNSLGSAPVTTESSIRFTASGIEMTEGSSSSLIAGWKGLSSMVFTDPDIVETITASTGLRLLHNPVEALIEPAGAATDNVHLTVTSLAGQTCIDIPEWQGEALDATGLAPGLYILTIDNQTLRFLKK